jgi:ribonuclease-3
VKEMQHAMEPPQPSPPDRTARDPAVEALEARLAQPIVNAEVALAALTHKSFVNEHRNEGMADNERLEFLGDAVLDLAVSHRLMERFPEAREGELSKIRAAVVDEPGLARMARTLELGPLLRLGRGEELTGGRQKASLLADAMEAVIAALYLGGGLEPVLALLDRFLGEAFARAAAGTLDRDYKTQLQELAQSRLRASPRYRVVAEHGPDHSKVFDVEAEIKGEVVGRGTGRSKKDAEQAAAKLALDAMTARLAEEKPAVAVPAPPPAVEATPAVEAPPAAVEVEEVEESVAEKFAEKIPAEDAVVIAEEPAPRRKPRPKRAATAKRAATRKTAPTARKPTRGKART